MVVLLADNAHALTPDVDNPLAIPSMGAVDCKHYRYAGIPAYVYGCSPKTSEFDSSRVHTTGDPSLCHSY